MTLLNRVKQLTATTGTGTITLGAAVDGYQTYAAAGATNGQTVNYVIEDGTAWEIGRGTYTASGTTLSRDTIIASSNSGAAINLSGDAVVFCDAFAGDLFDGDYGSLSGVPGSFPPSAHTHTVSQITDFPSVPSGELASRDRASVAQIRSLSGDAGITAERIAAAAAFPNVLNGGSGGVSFDWTAFVSDFVTLTGNRTLANPTGVIVGTTRAITFSGNSGSTRTLSFGSNFKGDLPTVEVTSSSFVTLFFYAVSATQILVSDRAWS